MTDGEAQPNYQAKREATGLTQARLAELLGYSRAYVNQVERGRMVPSARYKEAFLDATDSKEAAQNRIESKILSRKRLSSSASVISIGLSALDHDRHTLSKMIKAVEYFLHYSRVLAIDSHATPEATSFDPNVADSKDLEATLIYIMDVMVELLTEYNFDKMDPAKLNTTLGAGIKYVMTEMKKAKIRKEA